MRFRWHLFLPTSVFHMTNSAGGQGVLPIVFVGCFLLLAGPWARTQSVVDAIRRNRSDISVENGKLAGPGAAKIRAAVADTCYVFLGEDHGIAQVAQSADALTSELQPLGFNTFALEISTHAARQLSAELESADPDRAHGDFLRQHPMTVPFYNTQEEFSFLKHAKARSGTSFALIGFDQEFLGSSKFLLEEIGKQPLTPELRTQLDGFNKQEQQAMKRAEQTGRYQELFLLSANETELQSFEDRLRAHGFDAKPVEDLLASRRVYDLFAEDNHQSNETRDLLMKRNLVGMHGVGPPCKIFFKAGENHGFRGLGPLRTRELGNFLAESADGYANGGVHILILGGKGEALSFQAVGKPMKSTPVDALSSDFALHSLKPFVETALQYEPWSLFDLRQLRSLLETKSADPELQRLVYGFDLLVILPHPTASHELGP